jgi:hypothetical protein
LSLYAVGRVKRAAVIASSRWRSCV